MNRRYKPTCEGIVGDKALSDALTILNERLARGEITEEEYDRLASKVSYHKENIDQPTQAKQVKSATELSRRLDLNIISKNPIVLTFLISSLLITAMISISAYTLSSRGICFTPPCAKYSFVETITRANFILYLMIALVLLVVSVLSAAYNGKIIRNICLVFLALVFLYNLNELIKLLDGGDKYLPAAKANGFFFVCLPATLGAMVLSAGRSSSE